MLTIGLASQIVGIGYSILIQTGPTEWMRLVQSNNTSLVAATVVFVGCLGLLYPVLRGSRIALVLTVLMLALLVAAALPPLAFNFPRPAASFSTWFLNTTLAVAAALGAGFGVVALLEALGKVRPESLSTPTGTLTRPAAVTVAAASALGGMVVLAYAVAQNPDASTTVAEAPATMLRVPIQDMRFGQETLSLRAGETTAIFLINTDRIPHSFDVDALDIHVSVPSGRIAMALAKASASGAIPFYCAVPGHKDAGMVGTLAVQ